MTHDQDNNPPPPATNIEALLREQALQLDGLFHQSLTRFNTSSFGGISLKNALRAQSQCQATIRTLQKWRQFNTDNNKGKDA